MSVKFFKPTNLWKLAKRLPFACLSIIFLSTSRVYSSEPLGSVIQIQNQAEPGSGFFAKVGNQVIFVTAKHVLGSSGESIVLTLPNGRDSIAIPIEDQLPIKELDVAVLIVRKDLSGIVPLQTSNSGLQLGQQLVVWGYPVSDSTTLTKLSFRNGPYLGTPKDINDGYTLLYGSPTQIGFSGGPILDKNGNVIGMHGRSESKQSASGVSVKTGNALGIPIGSILEAISTQSGNSFKVDEQALALEAGKMSMKRIYEIMTNSSLSDQILSELSRAENGGIPKYCTEMVSAYYYTFFSALPDLAKAKSSLTIVKKSQGVDPLYYALGSLIGRKSADFKKSLEFNRILEQTGNGEYLQYSERRLQDEVRSAVLKCSK